LPYRRTRRAAPVSGNPGACAGDVRVLNRPVGAGADVVAFFERGLL
jgi:hypothetical protein